MGNGSPERNVRRKISELTDTHPGEPRRSNREWAEVYVRARRNIEGTEWKTLDNDLRSLTLLDRFLDGESWEHDDCGAWQQRLMDFRDWALKEAPKRDGSTGYAVGTVIKTFWGLRAFFPLIHDPEDYTHSLAKQTALRNSPPRCIAWATKKTIEAAADGRGNAGTNGEGYKPVSELRPSDLLTQRDMNALAEAAEHPQDKVVVRLLYSGCLRAVELASLQVGDIGMTTQGGARIHVRESKNEYGIRTVPVVQPVGAIAEHLEAHPFRDWDTAPFLIGRRQPHKKRRVREAIEALEAARRDLEAVPDAPEARQGLQQAQEDVEEAFDDLGASTSAITRAVDRVARNADLTKPIWPHLFRASRATRLFAEDVRRRKVADLGGWQPTSPVLDDYVSLATEALEAEVFRVAGVEYDDGQGDEPTGAPRDCPRCGRANDASNTFCHLCGCPLDGRVEMPEPQGTAEVNLLEAIAKLGAAGIDPADLEDTDDLAKAIQENLGNIAALAGQAQGD